MSGPAASLLLFDALTDAQWQDTVRLLERFSSPVEQRPDGSVDFWIRDGRPFGAGDVTCSGNPFSLLPEDGSALEDYDFGALGRTPVQELVVSAACTGPDNHRLLGCLAASLARRFDALIDCNGLLGYPYTIHRETPEQEAAGLTAARALVGVLDGTVLEVPYRTYDDGVWYSHVADPAFLESWLRHPDFRMIK